MTFSNNREDIHKSRFTAGIIDTGGNCTTGINDNGCKFAWHRWKIIGTISYCLHLKVNSKKKIYLCVNSTTQRCQNKIIKTIFFPVCHWWQRHRWCTLSCEYFREFSTKIWIGPHGILRGLRETDLWKNLVALSSPYHYILCITS